MFSIFPLYFLFFFVLTRTYAYDEKVMNTSLWLSSAAYCGKDKYSTMELTEYAKGFKVNTIIYDKTTDLQGFVGVLPSTNTIYVSFRGSSSMKNWVDDAEVLKVDYKTSQNVIVKCTTDFISRVRTLKKKLLHQLYNFINNTKIQ